jgi:hypothetical protein
MVDKSINNMSITFEYNKISKFLLDSPEDNVIAWVDREKAKKIKELSEGGDIHTIENFVENNQLISISPRLHEIAKKNRILCDN